MTLRRQQGLYLGSTAREVGRHCWELVSEVIKDPNFVGSMCQGIHTKLEHQSGKLADWVRDLLCRKSNFVVTCALANKLARIAWALTARQQTYVA